MSSKVMMLSAILIIIRQLYVNNVHLYEHILLACSYLREC
jgi:archaellum component FlaF (FlaF/FlaG flagellin family)